MIYLTLGGGEALERLIPTIRGKGLPQLASQDRLTGILFCNLQ